MNYIRLLFICVSLSVLIGCAGKMPPPVYNTQPHIEKTPKQVKEEERQKKKQLEKVSSQKQMEQRAQAAVKKLTLAISQARQKNIAELSKFNFDKARRFYTEAIDYMDAELFTEAIAASDKAQKILALAYKDAELQKEQEKKRQQQIRRHKQERKQVANELLKQQKAVEQQATNAVKQAVADVDTLEARGIPPKLKASLKATKLKLEESYKHLKLNQFGQAKRKADEVIASCRKLEAQSKNSANLPQPKNSTDNPQKWQAVKKYFKNHDYGKTYFALNDYLSEFPRTRHNAQALFLYGRCYEEFKSYDRALAAYAKLIDQYPATTWSSKAIFRSALTYTAISNYQLAEKFINQLKQVANAAKYTPHRYYAQGRLDQARGDYAQALKSYQDIIRKYKRSPQHSAALKSAAECLMALGKKEEARKSYWQIYKKHPKSKTMKEVSQILSKILYDQARDLTKEGTMSQAREKYQQLIRDFTDSNLLDNATYWLAETYYVEGNFKKALKYFRQVLDNDYLDYTDPGYLKDDDAVLKTAYCYYNLKQLDKARQAFQLLMDDYPKSEFKSDASYWVKLVESQQRH